MQPIKLIVANAWFQKSDDRKVTYESGDCQSVIDYLVVRRCDQAKVRDVKVIPGEECFS